MSGDIAPLPQFKGHVDWAEFPDGTPASGCVNPAVLWVIRRRLNFRTGRGQYHCRSTNGSSFRTGRDTD
jgi:hypothetical protein